MSLLTSYVSEGSSLDSLRVNFHSMLAKLPRALRLYALGLLALIGATTVHADSFSDGIAAYEQSEYATALQHFEASIAESETAAAQHNMALALFQTGSPAEAAWHIERAVRIDPLNTDYQGKLAALRQQLGLVNSPPQWYTIGAQLLPASTWLLIACLGFWLCLAAYSLPRIGGIRVSMAIKTVRFLSVCSLALALPAIWLHCEANKTGIVISTASAELHTAPASAAPSNGIARPGERARVLDQYNNFFQVETESRIIGWIAQNDFRALVAE